MKKNILKVTLVAAIAMACGISFLNSQKSEALSDIALANVEALADFVMNPVDCLYRPSAECGVFNKLPVGSYGQIYPDYINKPSID